MALRPLLFLCFGLAAPAVAAVADLPDVGVRIAWPDRWRQVSAEAHGSSIQQYDTADPRLARRMDAARNTTQLVLVRYAEPHRGVNPTLRLSLVRRGTVTAPRALELTVQTLKRLYPDARAEAGPAVTRVGGLPAAHVRVAYVADTPAGRVAMRSEQWAVERGAGLVFISVGMAAKEPEATAADVAAIVSTVEFAPAPLDGSDR